MAEEHESSLRGSGAIRVIRRSLTGQSLAFPPFNTSGYDGVKTGTTTSAGCCLVASGHRGAGHLLSAVLGAKASEDRFTDTQALFEWAWKQRGISR